VILDILVWLLLTVTLIIYR